MALEQVVADCAVRQLEPAGDVSDLAACAVTRSTSTSRSVSGQFVDHGERRHVPGRSKAEALRLILANVAINGTVYSHS
jgi:hypothetical protein